MLVFSYLKRVTYTIFQQTNAANNNNKKHIYKRKQFAETGV